MSATTFPRNRRSHSIDFRGADAKMAAGLAQPKLMRWTIGRRLALMGVVLATPLSLLLIATITNLAATSLDAQTATMHYSARAIAAAVDARLSRHTALAQTLAAEPEVLDD